MRVTPARLSCLFLFVAIGSSVCAGDRHGHGRFAGYSTCAGGYGMQASSCAGSYGAPYATYGTYGASRPFFAGQAGVYAAPPAIVTAPYPVVPMTYAIPTTSSFSAGGPAASSLGIVEIIGAAERFLDLLDRFRAPSTPGPTPDPVVTDHCKDFERRLKAIEEHLAKEGFTPGTIGTNGHYASAVEL